jgi:hypothetical protein
MASQFYGYNTETNPPNSEFILKGVFSLPLLYEKYLDSDYSRLFARAKIGENINFMKRGFYPNRILGDVDRINSDYDELNRIFKLE